MVGSVGEAQPNEDGSRENDWRKEGKYQGNQEITAEDNQVDRCQTLPKVLRKVFLQQVEIDDPTQQVEHSKGGAKADKQIARGRVKEGSQAWLVSRHELIKRSLRFIGWNGAAKETHGMNAGCNELEDGCGPDPKEVPRHEVG